MKFLSFLIFMILSFTLEAQEYKSIELVAAPSKVLNDLDKFFRSEGLLGFKHAEEYPEIGLNQIFFSADFSNYVTVKYDVRGDFPLDEIQKVEGGHLVHLKYDDKIIAFYFINQADLKVTHLVKGLRNLDLDVKTSWIKNLSPIPSAHATDCTAMILPIAGSAAASAISTMGSIAASAIISGLSSCLSGATEEAKSSSGLNFTNAVTKEATSLWNNPSKRIGEYWKSTKDTVIGMGELVYALADAIIHPADAITKLSNVLGESGAMLGLIVGELAKVPNLAVSMICSLVTGIGVRTLLAAISGGAAVMLLASKLGKVVKGMAMIGELMNKIKSLGLSRLEALGLSPENLAKIFSKMSAGTFEEKRLKIFINSLETNSEFAKTIAKRGLVCALQ